MVLKCFILPKINKNKHVFPHYDPTTHPWDYQSGDTKRGEGCLIILKVKKKFTLKFILGNLMSF